jgi:hypothetical protein
MKLIAEANGIEVFSAGNELDGLLKRGSQVQVGATTAQKLKDGLGRRRQGDACETIWTSDIQQESCLGPMVSMADYFPIDRRAGMASSIKMSMKRDNQPILPQIVCCPTDIPLISPTQGKKCDIFTGFANIVVGFDTCLFDQMRCDEQGVTLDDEYLPMVIESLNLGANYIAINGDDDANVIGLRNNTYIPTEIVASPTGTNIAVELRRIVNSMIARRNQIVDVSAGTLRQTYTLFLASNIVMSLANTWITLQNQQFSMLAILTGDCGLCATDPSIPKFRIISMDALNNAYFDGSDMGYIFNGTGSGLGSIARWHKPYSLIALPPATIGLREQKYFAARVGSVEVFNLCSVVRLIIPNSCSSTTGENVNPYIMR